MCMRTDLLHLPCNITSTRSHCFFSYKSFSTHIVFSPSFVLNLLVIYDLCFIHLASHTMVLPGHCCYKPMPWQTAKELQSCFLQHYLLWSRYSNYSELVCHLCHLLVVLMGILWVLASLLCVTDRLVVSSVTVPAALWTSALAHFMSHTKHLPSLLYVSFQTWTSCTLEHKVE